MSEKTLRKILKASNCKLVVTSEMYTGVKCYRAIDSKGCTIAQCTDVDDLYKALFN